MLTLNQLAVGEEASIVRVTEHHLQSRLTDMGLIAGQEVRVVLKAPLGDPIAIAVQDYVVSLRIAEAQLVEVSNLTND
ncbi:MAG: FeoA family protein [Cytophagales bacterium]|nr:FeoA family protein [Cytophagales bacterium]